MMLQSAVLGVGAYLVTQQEASAGVIIASSIIAGRALSPIDLAIANWKGFVAARQSWSRFEKLLRALPEQLTPLKLPEPAKSGDRGECQRGAARNAKVGGSGHQFCTQERNRPGRDRAERLG